MSQTFTDQPWVRWLLVVIGILVQVGLLLVVVSLILSSWQERGFKRTLKGIGQVIATLIVVMLCFSFVPTVVRGLFTSRPATPETQSLFAMALLIAVVLFWLKRAALMLYGALELALGISALWIGLPMQFDDPRIRSNNDAQDIAALVATIGGVYLVVTALENIGQGFKSAAAAERAEAAAADADAGARAGAA